MFHFLNNMSVSSCKSANANDDDDDDNNDGKGVMIVDVVIMMMIVPESKTLRGCVLLFIVSIRR